MEREFWPLSPAEWRSLERSGLRRSWGRAAVGSGSFGAGKHETSSSTRVGAHVNVLTGTYTLWVKRICRRVFIHLFPNYQSVSCSWQQQWPTELPRCAAGGSSFCLHAFRSAVWWVVFYLSFSYLYWGISAAAHQLTAKPSTSADLDFN